MDSQQGHVLDPAYTVHDSRLIDGLTIAGVLGGLGLRLYGDVRMSRAWRALPKAVWWYDRDVAAGSVRAR